MRHRSASLKLKHFLFPVGIFPAQFIFLHTFHLVALPLLLMLSSYVFVIIALSHRIFKSSKYPSQTLVEILTAG